MTAMTLPLSKRPARKDTTAVAHSAGRRAKILALQEPVQSIRLDEVHAEEALRQASAKLAKATQAANLAELLASIAHEVSEPLAAIVANSHACQRWLSAEPANVERAKITVERIIRDANSAANVVGRIRALLGNP